MKHSDGKSNRTNKSLRENSARIASEVICTTLLCKFLESEALEVDNGILEIESTFGKFVAKACKKSATEYS